MLTFIFLLPLVQSAAFRFDWCERLMELLSTPIYELDPYEIDAHVKVLGFAFATCECDQARYSEVLARFDRRISDLHWSRLERGSKRLLDDMIDANRAMVNGDYEYPSSTQGSFWETLRAYDMVATAAKLESDLKLFCPKEDFSAIFERMLYLGDHHLFLYELGALKRQIERHCGGSKSSMQTFIRFAAPASAAMFTEAMMLSPNYATHNYIQVREARCDLGATLMSLKTLYPKVNAEAQASLRWIAGGLRFGFTSIEGSRRFLLQPKVNCVRRASRLQGVPFLARVDAIMTSTELVIRGLASDPTARVDLGYDPEIARGAAETGAAEAKETELPPIAEGSEPSWVRRNVGRGK
jgi:hypothetical protein